MLRFVRNGFVLIEVLVSVVIVSIALLSLLAMLPFTTKLVLNNVARERSLAQITQVFDLLEASPDAAWALSVVSPDTGTLGIETLSSDDYGSVYRVTLRWSGPNAVAAGETAQETRYVLRP